MPGLQYKDIFEILNLIIKKPPPPMHIIYARLDGGFNFIGSVTTNG